MKRSDVEFAKRVFLDRLTTDDQPLAQAADADQGPGDEYDYAGVYDAGNFGVGADCSGSSGIFVGIALRGPGYYAGGYTRQFSTESFPGPFDGFRRVTRDDLLAHPYPIKVAIHHGGGGPNSHMNVEIDGWLMESNGSHGTCTRGHGAIEQSDPYWNDWWVHDGPITEDTTWRQPMGYPRGLDYAGGRIPGTALKAAGIAFVCRYLSDGGPSLPGKLLLPAEAADLRANGIAIVSNWETTANRMLGGADAGRVDAQAARAQVVACGGPADGVIYFSADWDATEAQQGPINNYLAAAGVVLGGPEHVGIYAGFWPLSRALDAGVCRWAWQTEAWSGSNRDARANIIQRNKLGYQTVAGVQCDVNEAHTDDYGQWGTATPPVVVPSPPATPPTSWPATATDRELLEYLAEQLGPGRDDWGADGDLGRNPQGQRRTFRAGMAALIRKAGA